MNDVLQYESPSQRDNKRKPKYTGQPEVGLLFRGRAVKELLF